nr:hypothetical protein [Microbispora sp. H10830]
MLIVEPFVLAQGVPQVAFVPYEAAVEKFPAARLHRPLHDRVHPRHPDTSQHRLDAGLGEDLVHERGELSVPVSDQKARPTACIVQIHHQVPDRLDDPVCARVCGGAEHTDTSGGVLDHRQDVLALSAEGDGLDEVAGQQGIGLRAQEVGPRGGRPLGRRINTCLLEDLPYRGRCDLDTERGELTVDPLITPAWILSDQAQNESADGADRGRAPTSLRPADTGMTPVHQIAVPAQDRIRADEEPQPAQDLARHRGHESGEKGPVFGSGSDSGVGAELAFKDGDLVTQDENLHVLVPIAHGEQPQRGERVRDGEVGQAKEHSGSSCRTRFRLPGGRSSRTLREALAEP